MPRKRFEEIKRNLHVNNNAAMPSNCGDKLYKVRPFIDSICKKFNELPQGENLSVDEQIIPFKGKHSIKQYLPKKPKKWGYKVFVCSSESGLVHNFQIYTTI